MLDAELPQPGDSPRRIVIELTNICNLHCSYCLRDEEALYQTRARFFPIDLLRRILRDAREAAGVSHVSFTGGEPTLHPQFGGILEAVGAEGMRASFVTNGWHFDRVWPLLDAHRSTVSVVSFSVDGATRETHDRWRGEGSFDRVIRAFTRCRMGLIPFAVKAVIRRDTVPQFQDIVLLAARMGAQAIHFSHVLPTSGEVESESAMSLEERAHAEQEIALLRRILKMPVALDVGYANTDPAPPCAPLQGSSFSVDYQGRLSLCCNMSGFRGAARESDVVADLNEESFTTAWLRVHRLAAEQVARRAAALAAPGAETDLHTASPCLLCLQTFGKIPWHSASPRPDSKLAHT
ncbi:MAG TPA: radical SAM protein [Thermoanaerobaculia bacterium]|nr:radical SAM protein [Thermoanaerobaculia bacterium]